MPRPREHTPEQVFAAANLLLIKDRKRPTRERVSAALGMSSCSTIGSDLELWWDHLAKLVLGDAKQQEELNTVKNELAELRGKVATLLVELNQAKVVPLPLRKVRFDALIAELHQKVTR